MTARPAEALLIPLILLALLAALLAAAVEGQHLRCSRLKADPIKYAVYCGSAPATPSRGDSAWQAPVPTHLPRGRAARSRVVLPRHPGKSHAPRGHMRAQRTREHHAQHLPAVLLRIRGCESGNDYQNHSQRLSTASGAFQILDGTWHHFGGYARAYMAPRAVQDRKALALYRSRGTQPWAASRGCWG